MARYARHYKESFMQVKIECISAPYPAWRRIICSDELTLDTFMHVMVAAMGWDDYHISSININDKEYIATTSGGVDAMFVGFHLDSEPLDGSLYFAYEKFKTGTEAYMLYDFGDCWRHKITIEEIYPELPKKRMRVPSCIDGEGACPPEDCGGEPGLERLIELMEDPKKDPYRYKELREWLGYKFKKESFSIRAVNRALQPFRV